MDILIEFGGIIARHLQAVSWQVSILAVIIGIISLIARKVYSEFRYWLWCIVLIRLCIPIGLSLPVGIELNPFHFFETHEKIINEDKVVSEKTSTIQTIESFQAHPDESVKSIVNPSKAITVSHLTFQKTFILSWSVGILLIVTILIWRVIKLNFQLKKCSVIERSDLRALLRKLRSKMGIKQRVSLHYLEMETVKSPAVSGIFKPRIYLPKTIVNTFSPEELEPILLHELSHIKRLDGIINWVQIIVQAFYFFHPLVWLVNRKIRHLREEVCDDMALHYLGYEKDRYSQSILSIVKNINFEPAYGFFGLGFTERKSSLLKRIKRVMSEKYIHYSKMKISTIEILGLIGMLSISLASSEKSPKSYYDLDTAIKIAKLGDSLITSGKGNYNYEFIRVDSLSEGNINRISAQRAIETGSRRQINVNTKKMKVFFAFDGNKVRCDEISLIPLGTYFMNWKRAYNGEKTDFLMMDKSRPNSLVNPRGTISGENIIEMYFYDPRFYGVSIAGVPIASFLNKNEVNYVKDEVIDGEKCKIFKGKLKVQKELFNINIETYTVWLMENKLFRPKRIEIESSNYYPYIVINNEFKEYSDNIIYPYKIIIEKYFINKNNNKKYISIVETYAIADDYLLNIDLPDSLFIIEFPKGLMVKDLRIGKK